jgi:hypothetical protein
VSAPERALSSCLRSALVLVYKTFLGTEHRPSDPAFRHTCVIVCGNLALLLCGTSDGVPATAQQYGGVGGGLQCVSST